MRPIRCYTCNAVRLTQRMCCRRMELGYVDLTRDQMQYPNEDLALDEAGTVLKRRVGHTRIVSCD